MVSVGQGSRHRLAESSAQGVTVLKSKCWLRLQSHLGLRVLCTGHVVVSRTHCLAAAWLTSLFSCCQRGMALSTWRSFSGLCHAAPPISTRLFCFQTSKRTLLLFYCSETCFYLSFNIKNIFFVVVVVLVGFFWVSSSHTIMLAYY